MSEEGHVTLDNEGAESSVATPQIEDGPVDRPRPEMTAEQMRRHLTEVGERLATKGVTGELVLTGGAVMVMALHARGGSRDVDAVFVKEADAIRETWAGDPVDQRDLGVIAKALDLTGRASGTRDRPAVLSG